MRRLLPFAAVLMFGCDKIDYLELKPTQVVLKQPNNEVWMEVKAMSQQGVHSPRAEVGWSIKDPEIASVDKTGKVRPLKSGHTEVIAKHASVEASVPVDVLFVEKVEPAVKEVTVTEGGDPVELHAKAFDYQGHELKDRTPTFRSSDPKVVSMGQNNCFGLAPGEATVEVQVDGVKSSIHVTVEPDKTKPKK